MKSFYQLIKAVLNLSKFQQNKKYVSFRLHKKITDFKLNQIQIIVFLVRKFMEKYQKYTNYL